MSDTVSIKMNDDCPTGHNCLFSEKLFELSDEITRLRAENERLRETLRSILSFPAKPLHLTRDYRIRLPEHILFEAAFIFEQSCKEAKRAVIEGVTKKKGAGNE